jgi:hypothetical protein
MAAANTLDSMYFIRTSRLLDGSFLALTISIKNFQFVTLVLKRLTKFGH